MEARGSIDAWLNDKLSEGWQIALRSAVVLLVYYVLEMLLIDRLRLSNAAYSEPVILVETAKHVLAKWPLLVAGLAFLVLLASRFRLLTQAWSALDDGKQLRWFVTLVAFVLAWFFTTYDYNLYHDQAHYVDRILLIALVPLIFWRPVFVLPFLVVLSPIIWQFSVPLSGYSWAFQDMPIRLLIVFVSIQLVGSVWRRSWSMEFVFLSVCVIGAHYWAPGYVKLSLNWVVHDHVNFLLPATYSNGWLAMLEPETIGKITRILGYGNPLFKGITMFVEVVILLAFWRRRLLIALLGAAALNHVGIWLMSGICFWPWVLIDVAMIGVLVRANTERVASLFTRSRLLVAFVIIGGAKVWFSPTELSWYDSRVSYAYRMEGVASDSTKWDLHPRFFAPFDYQFSLGAFHHMDRAKNLGVTWGATGSLEIADALAQTRTAAEAIQVEQRLGIVRYDEQRSGYFDQFVQRFIGNYNARRSKRTVLSSVRSPPELWTFPRARAPDGSHAFDRIDVYRETSLFDGTTVMVIERKLIRSIEIP